LTAFQKISWEETEKQTARSCRAWEFSRSRAQEKVRQKRKDVSSQLGSSLKDVQATPQWDEVQSQTFGEGIDGGKVRA
jgi:hypothetical protein